MKKIIPLIIVYFFVVSNLFSQVRDELNYYPLHIGDVWQYKVTYTPERFPERISYLIKRVISDTVLSNGRKYFLIEQPPFTYDEIKNLERVLIRIDTTSGIVYKYITNQQPEEKVDSLFSEMGDSYFGIYKRLICWGVYNDTVFGQLRKVKTIGGPITTNGLDFTWHLAMDIGIYQQGITFAIVTATGNSYDLVYAKINGKEYGTYLSINDETEMPLSFHLFQNYPNPFNPTTTIKYSIPAVETFHGTSLQQHVTLKIYDILGKEIVALVNEEKLPGNYETTFNGSKLASGVYFYKLITKDFSLSKKMILMK